MPKLWSSTLETHRREVHEAVLDAAGAMVMAHGLRSVTMSQIAERAGVGRATLYKYFPDVDAVLQAWHERHVAGHLEQLTALAHRCGPVGQRLEAVLATYGLICHRREQHGRELGALLHRGRQVATAEQQLTDLVRDLIDEAAAGGEVRTDLPPEELAGYCLHALSAAGGLPDDAAVARLVAVTLDGLRAAH